MNKEKYTKEQKIDYINRCVKFKGKKISKSQLKTWPDSKIDAICERFADDFKDFIKNPPVKLTKFYIEATDKQGDRVTMEASYFDAETCEKSMASDGYKIARIVPARGHHICMYCNGIADGAQKDILCDDCRDMFGHYSYYEL